MDVTKPDQIRALLRPVNAHQTAPDDLWHATAAAVHGEEVVAGCTTVTTGPGTTWEVAAVTDRFLIHVVGHSDSDNWCYDDDDRDMPRSVTAKVHPLSAVRSLDIANVRSVGEGTIASNGWKVTGRYAVKVGDGPDLVIDASALGDQGRDNAEAVIAALLKVIGRPPTG